MTNETRMKAVFDALKNIDSNDKELNDLIDQLLQKLELKDQNFKELTNVLTNLVNNYTMDNELFCSHMSSEHRTLQQSFTRLALSWFEWLSEAPDRFFDPRNKQSKEISQKVIKLFCEANGTPCTPDYYPSKWLSFI